MDEEKETHQENIDMSNSIKANPKECMKETWQQLMKNLIRILPFFLVALLFFVLVGFSGYLTFLLLITIPFILLPFFAALTVVVDASVSGMDLNGKLLGLGLRSYFRHPFFGNYRIIRTFIYGFLIIAILGPILESLLILSSSSWNPALFEEVNTLYSLIGQDGSFGSSLFSFPEEYPNIYNFSMYFLVGEIGVIFAIFVYRQNNATIVPMISGHLNDPRIAYPLLRRTIRDTNGAYLKDYWAGNAISLSIPLLGYVIGSLIGGFTLPSSWLIPFALIFGLVFYLFALLWHLNYVVVLFHKYEKAFAVGTYRIMEEMYQRFRTLGQISEEEANRFEEMLKEAKNNLENENPSLSSEDDEEEEKEETTSSHHDLSDYGPRDYQDKDK